MSRKTKYPTASYRYCQIINQDGSICEETLEELFLRVFNENETEKKLYKRTLSEDRHDSLLINFEEGRPFNMHNRTCGALLEREAGAKTNVVEESTNKLQVSALSLRNEDGVNKEFEQNPLQFALCGNHVLFLGGRGRGAERLSEFFDWLFRENLSEYGGKLLTLANKVDEKVLNHITEGNLKELRLRSSQADEARGTVFERILKAIPRPRKAPIDHSEGEEKKVRYRDASDALNIKLDVSCSEKNKDEIKILLVGLVHSLGEDVPEALTIVMRDGSQIRGSNLIVKRKLSLTYYDGVISHDDVMRRIARSLTDLINERSVSRD